MSDAIDILVDTPNPEALDQTVQSLGAVVVGGGTPGGYVKHDGHYVVRALMAPDFVKFAIEQQGYATIVGELDELL
jgi:hypothetical protein